MVKDRALVQRGTSKWEDWTTRVYTAQAAEVSVASDTQE